MFSSYYRLNHLEATSSYRKLGNFDKSELTKPLHATGILSDSITKRKLKPTQSWMDTCPHLDSLITTCSNISHGYNETTEVLCLSYARIGGSQTIEVETRVIGSPWSESGGTGHLVLHYRAYVLRPCK